ncbi:MAG: hypothetical protein JST01_28310 [Cyanobacteria bacterium SZAS TMP-1]|nr:hypothetical protein [Cyanobacteria bacterium SZAS TMP-1]
MSNIRETQFAALNSRSAEPAVISGKFKPAINSAVKALSTGFAGIEVEPDASGFVRHLTGANGLFSQTFGGDVKAHAVAFIGSALVSKALDLEHIDIDRTNPVVEAMPFGHRVMFNQTVTLKDGSVLPVRGATVHVAMDANGKIFNVSSTLKHGRVMSIRGICSEAEAIALAKAKFGRLVTQLSKTAGKEYARDLKGAIKTCSHKIRLVASENDGRLDPVYEVTLSTCEPRQHVEFLVKAKTREVVHYHSKMHFSVANPKAQAALGRIAAKCFLQIPDPNKPINQQVVDYFVENLPDPKVLANERYIMLVREGGKWVPVTAKADGTFNYSPSGKEQDRFSAVVAFVALNLQSEINEGWGLKKQDRAIQVFINDPSGTDNAYFDPENYEIHTLKGTGTKNGGLNEMIGWDLGVLWHENGHHEVYLQCPAKDLPGSQGGACNEGAAADVLGQMMMQYMFALMFGKITKQTLTVKDIQADPRIIGLYAMPPHGIRQQRNTKTMADLDGEVHDDGEIVGGAMADALQGYVEHPDVTSGKISLQDQLINFGKAGKLLLALAPTRSVKFTDWRRCHITADQQLTGGANRAAIEKAYDAHGITAGTATQPNTKTKGKGKGRKTTPRRR